MIAIQFDVSNGFGVISTANGTYQAGTMWLNGYDIWGVSCTAKISGTTITFSNELYSRYACSTLGYSPIFNAGDSANITSIYAIQYSVSRVIFGTKIITTKSDNPTPLMFTESQYKSLTGHTYNANTDHVLFSNGDWSACPVKMGSAIFGSGNIYASIVDTPKNDEMRIDYLIATKYNQHSVSPTTIAESTSTSYESFSVDLSNARMIGLLCCTSEDDRPISVVIDIASHFVSSCTTKEKCLSCVYAPEINNYEVNSYYSNKTLYLKTKSVYDKAIFIKF